MRNVEIVKPSDFLPPAGMPDELLQEDREEAAKKSMARRVRKKVEQDIQSASSAYELVFTMTINALYRGMAYLAREDVASPFESGQQGDADASWAMDWVAEEVTSMVSKTCSHKEFDVWLCRVDGIIRCAYSSLTNKDTAYARQLAWMKKTIEIFGEMLDLADREGSKFLQREVAA